MKQKKLLMVILVMAMMMPVMAQKKQRTDPDHAKYSITGTMKFENGMRLLEGATGKHIKFAHKDSRWAKPTDMADLRVQFDSVRTDPYHPMTKLDFWRYDEEIGEWIYDSEVRQGEEQLESTMTTNILLVIDNSSSLGEDFKKVQDAAIEFVQQLYNASKKASLSKDIFRVGVIGFSTVKFTRIREITPLNDANYRSIVSFIESLKMQNGTALYYSLETALNMLESDAQKNINPDEYKESRIYAFTDGLDQASVDDSRNLTTPTEYYDYLRPIMIGASRKRIMDLPDKKVYSTIVTVRGDDMTDGQERQFDKRANEICDNVRKLKDISQLVNEFQQLAKDLVNSNKVLYCYIPVGANGRVGWTFADEQFKIPSIPRIQKPNKLWAGIGLEVGVCDAFTFGVQADATYPLSSRFSLGGSFSLTTNTDDVLTFAIGPLAKIDFKNNSALLFGFGLRTFDAIVNDYSYYYDYHEYLVRFCTTIGWKFRSPWYVTGYYAMVDGGPAFGIGVGYSIFGGK